MKNLRNKLEDTFIDSGLDFPSSTARVSTLVRSKIEMPIWRLQEIIYFFNKPEPF